MRNEVLLPILNRQGGTLAKLQLVDRSGPSVEVLDEQEANAHGEETIQLLEGRRYDFILRDCAPELHLDETTVVQPNRLNDRVGRLEPGLHAGLLTIELVDGDSVRVGAASVEVRTSKLGYRTHYRHMLDQIADESMALLLDISGAAQARLQLASTEPETLHQQFVIIRALIERRELDDAISRITGSPHRRWVTHTTELDPRQALRIGPSQLQQLVSRPERISLRDEHPLAQRLARLGVLRASLPSRFTVAVQSDEIDTPENRFVKFALQDWDNFLVHVQSAAGGNRRVIREVTELRRRVSLWSQHPIWREVGPLTMLPLSSPVLQRRPGYRETLRAWTSFRLATSLRWAGGSDVFGGGKKDVALLYEYWLFFKLLRLVEQIFELDAPPSWSLIDQSANGLDLHLRSGKQMTFTGRYKAESRTLGVRFSYNRTFPRASTYPAPGAWTRAMRPDYTLSLWPLDMEGEAEAERQEALVHIHLDAKYRIEEIASLFGQVNAEAVDVERELDIEREAFRAGSAPKRADLLKMHAYRDAIRRSEGAYVLFPGRDPISNEENRAFDDIVPGLGAFAVTPGEEDRGLSELKTFLINIAEYVADDARRLDQQTYHLFRIQEPSGRYRSSVSIPARDERGRRLRRRPRIES